jgi:hypothetical protein
MHYVPHRSHWIKKHKFGVTCLVALFMESVLVPPEHEKLCINIWRNGMHYATHRSHQMQKHKFGVTCPSTLFVVSVSVPPEHVK